ncbi:MAG: hypothetical protein R6U98_35970 [Pirellulaceae bacterium]
METSRLAAHLAECLRGVHARRVTVDGNRVLFRGGLFRFVDRWNVLVPFGAGELHIDTAARVVHYRLSFAQLMITVTLLVGFLGCLMFFLPLPEGAGTFPPSLVAAFCAFAWVALVGGNAVIGLARFTTFLRRSIERVNEASGDNQSLDRNGRSG